MEQSSQSIFVSSLNTQHFALQSRITFRVIHFFPKFLYLFCEEVRFLISQELTAFQNFPQAH